MTLCVWDPCFAILKDGSPTVDDGDDITVVVVGLSVVVLGGFTVGNGDVTKEDIIRDGKGGGLSYPYPTSFSFSRSWRACIFSISILGVVGFVSSSTDMFRDM